MHWLVVLLQVCLWRAVFSVVRVLRPGLPAATGSRCTGSIREERRHLCCESTKESFALICSAVLSMDFALLGFFFWCFQLNILTLSLFVSSPSSSHLCFQIGERIRVILDMEDKTLAFERGYEFLGVAFRGLPKVCLYPAVSAVYGNTEVTLVYLGKPLDG